MPRVAFEALPDHARLWVFAAERALRSDERDTLLGIVDGFLDTWAAHGQPLTAGRDLRYDRFVLVAVDERAAGVSGCSIDALTRQLRDLESRFGVALLDNAPVHYRTDTAIGRASRAAFGELADQGALSPDTVVFDNTAADVGAVRQGRWETAARDTWVGRVFFG